MALERFSFARDLIAGFRKAFGDHSGFITAVTLVDSTGADASATLPTGAATAAKQDTGNTSLAVMDDWDESDRAKVNPIVGQAGVAAGAGAVGATVQRVTLASDDPAVARLPATLGRKSAALSLAVVPAGMSYEAVAASDTDEPLGTTGAAGDYLSHIIIQPITTGAGAVTVKDGASTIFLFTSGTLADLSPKTVPFGITSTGILSITTGANVTVLAVGNFT